MMNTTTTLAATPATTPTTTATPTSPATNSLSGSGELLTSFGGSGSVFNIPSDNISHLLRSSDYSVFNNETNLSAPPLAPYPVDLFHNSQVFKGFPEGLYSYLSTNTNNRSEEGECRGPAPCTSTNLLDPGKLNKWMNASGGNKQNEGEQKQAKNGEQVMHPSVNPLAFSTGAKPPLGIAVPTLPGITINAQGSIIHDEASDDQSPRYKKRPGGPSDDLIQGDGEKAVKKKRRQEKNREAAQLFRQRQKAKVTELERAVHDLTGNNAEYRMKMEILSFENKILAEQLHYLKSLVLSGISITAPPGYSPVPVLPNLEKADAALNAAVANSTPTLPPPPTLTHPPTPQSQGIVPPTSMALSTSPIAPSSSLSSSPLMLPNPQIVNLSSSPSLLLSNPQVVNAAASTASTTPRSSSTLIPPQKTQLLPITEEKSAVPQL